MDTRHCASTVLKAFVVIALYETIFVRGAQLSQCNISLTAHKSETMSLNMASMPSVAAACPPLSAAATCAVLSTTEDIQSVPCNGDGANTIGPSCVGLLPTVETSLAMAFVMCQDINDALVEIAVYVIVINRAPQCPSVFQPVMDDEAYFFIPSSDPDTMDRLLLRADFAQLPGQLWSCVLGAAVSTTTTTTPVSSTTAPQGAGDAGPLSPSDEQLCTPEVAVNAAANASSLNRLLKGVLHVKFDAARVADSARVLGGVIFTMPYGVIDGKGLGCNGTITFINNSAAMPPTISVVGGESKRMEPGWKRIVVFEAQSNYSVVDFSLRRLPDPACYSLCRPTRSLQRLISSSARRIPINLIQCSRTYDAPSGAAQNITIRNGDYFKLRTAVVVIATAAASANNRDICSSTFGVRSVDFEYSDTLLVNISVVPPLACSTPPAVVTLPQRDATAILTLSDVVASTSRGQLSSDAWSAIAASTATVQVSSDSKAVHLSENASFKLSVNLSAIALTPQAHNITYSVAFVTVGGSQLLCPVVLMVPAARLRNTTTPTNAAAMTTLTAPPPLATTMASTAPPPLATTMASTSKATITTTTTTTTLGAAPTTEASTIKASNTPADGTTTTATTGGTTTTMTTTSDLSSGSGSGIITTKPSSSTSDPYMSGDDSRKAASASSSLMPVVLTLVIVAFAIYYFRFFILHMWQQFAARFLPGGTMDGHSAGGNDDEDDERATLERKQPNNSKARRVDNDDADSGASDEESNNNPSSSVQNATKNKHVQFGALAPIAGTGQGRHRSGTHSDNEEELSKRPPVATITSGGLPSVIPVLAPRLAGGGKKLKLKADDDEDRRPNQPTVVKRAAGLGAVAVLSAPAAAALSSPPEAAISTKPDSSSAAAHAAGPTGWEVDDDDWA